MIQLLPMPWRPKDADTGKPWQDQVVTLKDPDGAYLNSRAQDHSRPDAYQVIVKGPMLGTALEYAAAVSERVGFKMVVKQCDPLPPDPKEPEEKQAEIRRVGFVSIIVEPDDAA